jgi:tRNA(adenine34) deaminase
MTSEAEHYMQMALAEARRARDEGNDPYGAVVVRGSQFVTGRNCTATTRDPTAHSEVVAIRTAASTWSTLDLRGTVLYTSFEPCPMCCGAILVSGITSVVIGARPTLDASRLGTYSVEKLLDLAGRLADFTIHSDVLAEECKRFYASTG